MMDSDHNRRVKFFEEQYWYADEFISNYLPIDNYENINILEIGSAEGGGLKCFFEKKANCWGIEISKQRNQFAKKYVNEEKIKYIEGDICDPKLIKSLPKMDVILIRDVIEHIPNKIEALKNMQLLLKDDGILFLSFPPKYSPYAGHQQNVKSFIGRLPFIHLFPKSIYKRLIGTANMVKATLKDYMDTKRDMISIKKIENLFKKANLDIDQKDFYFVRPCFKKRFGWNSKKNMFKKIPLLNEVFTLGALYQLKKKA